MPRRRIRRKPLPEAGIMIAPLLDCIFILLLFFMLVNRFLAPSINVDLPRSVSADITEEKALNLAIDKDANLFLNQAPVEWENLVAALTTAKEESHPEIVRIKSDKTVPIETVVKAIDAVRAAGMKSVALETATREALEAKTGGE
ncbi:MAG: biopolymer transporter ExbD [bacterium]|jgi:biopolymer transport protein ExbD